MFKQIPRIKLKIKFKSIIQMLNLFKWFTFHYNIFKRTPDFTVSINSIKHLVLISKYLRFDCMQMSEKLLYLFADGDAEEHNNVI